MSDPWPVSFSAEQLAGALRLRLPDVAVRVVASVPDDSAVPAVELVADDPPRIRLVRSREVLIDVPLPASEQGSPRRAALFAAIALETAPDPPAAPPPTSPSATVAAAAPPAAAPATGWAIAAAVGSALAVDDDTADAAPALLLRLHAPLTAAVSLELGAKLSGTYGATGGQDLSIVDRCLWIGAGYRLDWRQVAVQLGLAGQYSAPAVDVDGETAPVEDPIASRFGVRVAVDVAWKAHRNLAVVAGAAVTFGLADRELTIAGRDAAELGSAMLDLTIGPEVRW